MTLPTPSSRAARLVAGVTLGAAISMNAATARAQDAALDVVASFSVIADMAARVGGERIALTTLVGPDEDAHVYEPRPRDAARMAEADVVLVNGLGFEGFLDRLVEVSQTDATVVALGDAITPLPAAEEAHHDDHGDEDDHAHDEEGHDDHAEEDHAHGDHGEEHHDAEHAEHDDHHDHGPNDPHAWHSLDHAQTYVTGIADAFCVADADGCDGYRANAEAYAAEIAALDADIRASLDAIPEGARTIITSHDAFGYLAEAYGLTILAPQGLSTEAEASAADVARLIDQIRADNVGAVFVENVANPRLVERIAAETGLDVGGRLYGDALSGADGPAPTYIDMMRHNTRTIVGALAGT